MKKRMLAAIVAPLLLQVAVYAQNGNAKVAANNNQAASQTLPPITPAQAEEYVIGPEDVLAINVWKEPELTSRVIVRPDGKIGMALLNEIQAGGLTPRQLQESISDGLKKYMSTPPSVSVIVNEIRSPVVYISGNVGKAGVYILGSPTTIMEMLIRAGGLSEFAKSEEVQILRPEGNSTRRFRFNFKTFSEGRDFQQNIPLRRGDIILVP